MNRWYQVRRMRGATFLILVGVLALLNQWHILSWSRSWPLFLIVAGLLLLAERAAWTADAREQQMAQSMTQPGQPLPSWPAGGLHAPGSPSVNPEQPFVQTHPPEHEGFGREDR